MEKKNTEKPRFFDVGFFCKNTLICLMATALLLLMFAVFTVYLPMEYSLVNLLVGVLAGGCIFWGGFRIAKHTGRQGLLQGGFFGLVYGAIRLLIGMLVAGAWQTYRVQWLTLLIGVLCGALGGMMGVNVKPKRKS